MRDRFDKDITDRFGKNDGGGSFMMGLLTGTVVGVGLGMLFAPKAGSELRNQLSEQAGSLATQAQDGIRKVTETTGDWAERGRDMYGKAKDAVVKGADEAQKAVVKGADEAQKYVRDNAGPLKDAASRGVDEAERYVRDTANSVKDAVPTSTGPRHS